MSGTLTKSFVGELGQGLHNLSSDTLMLALYKSDVALGKTTTQYTATQECEDGGDYSAGGVALVKSWQTTGDVPYLSISDITLEGLVGQDIYQALIYNATFSNKSVAWFTLDRSYNFNSGAFTLRFPPNNGNEALIRITGVSDG